jgi:hypothetical protein
MSIQPKGDRVMKTCFGTIYPDLSKLQFNQEIAGKVFHMRINTLGPGHKDPHLSINTKEWEDCQRCELYRNATTFPMPRW